MGTAAAPSPSLLSDLKSVFETQIQSTGEVTISESNTGIAALTSLLNQTIGASVVVSNVALDLSMTSLTLSGVLTFLQTNFNVALAFTETDGKLSLQLHGIQAPGSSLSLKKLVAALAPLATNCPSIVLSDLQISFDTAASSYLLGASAAWQIPVGQNQPQIQANLVISPAGVNLSGQLAIGKATFSVVYQIQSGGQILTGVWSDSANPLGWDSVVTALGLSPSLSLPANIPNAGFQAAQLNLDFGTGKFTLSGQSAKGAAFLLASKQNNSWGFAFGAAVGANWQFNQISSGLGILDFLVFQNAYLLISSVTQPQFIYPEFPPMTTPIDVVPGLNFGMVINFASGTTVLAKNTFAIVGQSTATGSGSIGSTLPNTRLTAALGGSITIPPAKNLKLTNPQLIVIGSGPTVEIQGTLEIALKNQVIDIIGRMGISPEKASFTMDAKGKSLLAPFGFVGVTLEEIGASVGVGFTPPSLDLALEAVFRIGSTAADKCAIEFEVVPDAVNPVLLWAQFSSLSLPVIFGAMFPKVKLPSDLSALVLKGAYVFYCEQPTVLPDNTAVVPGFAISGTLDAFSFTMAASLKIDFASGISGSAAMPAIHLINHALDVTGTGPFGGPSVAFNTIASPFLNVTLDVQLMGVTGTKVIGKVTSAGFSFQLAFVIANVLNEALQCTFKDYHTFSASTDLHFQLNIVSPPITAPNVNLGTIHINTAFTGHMILAITATSLTGFITGTFDGRALPSVAIDANTKSLQTIPAMVQNQIQTQIRSIYSDVLSNSSKWASMVASGAITGADDAAKVLTGFFGESVTSSLAILKQFKLHGNTTVHVDTTAPHEDTTVHTDVAEQRVNQSGPHLDTGHGGSLGPFHQDSHGDSTPHIDKLVSSAVNTTTHADARPHISESQHVDV